jgi:photosystem II stability/assembly factor-like uncharacterized protein
VLPCVCCLLLALVSWASAESWIAVGPPGGDVRALAADPDRPSRLYLGTADGVLYRSEDQGSSWQRLNPGFPLRGFSLDQIAVAPHDVVFVGYWQVDRPGGGVARSTDGGRTFTSLKDLEHESVRALALAPSNPSVVAAGTLTGVFLSHDSGRSWKRITPSDSSAKSLRNIESLAFDPTNPRTLYAGTWHLAWKTLDDGAHWLPVHRGMIDDSDVMSLVAAPDSQRTLYAGACTGVYRSHQGGHEASDWSHLEGIPYASRRTRSLALSSDGKLLAAGTTDGLFLSEDGAPWRRVTSKELVINSLLLQPDGTIVLGTEEAGVLLSSDRGLTWKAGNAGFSERLISRILWGDGGRVFVSTLGAPRFGGVFTALDVRGPWERLAEGLGGRTVLSLVRSGQALLVGTDDGIFVRGPDDGAWQRREISLDNRELHSRVTDLAVVRGEALVAGTPEGLIRSEDGGGHWARADGIGNSKIESIAQSPNDDRLLLAISQRGLFRSTDGGASWNQISDGVNGLTPHRVAFVPSRDNVLLATTSDGLFRSGDRGESWERVTGGIPQCDLSGIAVDMRGRTIYASNFTVGGIFRSRDGGRSWKRMPVDGLASDRVWTLGVGPSSPDRLLVAPAAGGLHLWSPNSVGVMEPSSVLGGAPGTESGNSP